MQAAGLPTVKIYVQTDCGIYPRELVRKICQGMHEFHGKCMSLSGGADLLDILTDFIRANYSARD